MFSKRCTPQLWLDSVAVVFITCFALRSVAGQNIMRQQPVADDLPARRANKARTLKLSVSSHGDVSKEHQGVRPEAPGLMRGDAQRRRPVREDQSIIFQTVASGGSKEIQTESHRKVSKNASHFAQHGVVRTEWSTSNHHLPKRRLIEAPVTWENKKTVQQSIHVRGKFAFQGSNNSLSTNAKNGSNRTRAASGRGEVIDATLVRAKVLRSLDVAPSSIDSDDCEYNIARYRKAARWIRHLAGLDPKPSRELSIGIVVEPIGPHTSTVFLLHGLGDTSSYWRPFYDALRRKADLDLSGVRWVPLDAPVRTVWGSAMPAWFEYYTCRCGQAEEDEISTVDLSRMREQLHRLIHEEALKLEAGTLGIFLVGSSQGGSVALDAALSYRAWEESNSDPDNSTRGLGFAGVAMLRGLPLGITAKAVLANGAPVYSSQALPLLAVSGGRDRTFSPSLVTSQLRRISPIVKLSHRIVPRLTHQVSYNPAEIAYFISWFGRGHQKRVVRVKQDVLPVIPAKDAGENDEYEYDDEEDAEDDVDGNGENV